MAESRIKDENYYQIQGWMINRLGLKGIPLSVYAIIYGFSQDGENEYTGSLQYLCDFCGGVSKPTIISALKMLVEAKYIFKREEIINNVQFNRYKVNLPLLKKFYYPDKEITSEGVKEFNEGSKETLPNNKSHNKNNNNKNNNMSAEAETASTEDTPMCAVYLPLIDGTEYGVQDADIDMWRKGYPAIDIIQELHKMKAWLDANPKNRKTYKGIKRFIIGWLGKAQNSAPKTNNGGTNYGQTNGNNGEACNSRRYGIQL